MIYKGLLQHSNKKILPYGQAIYTLAAILKVV